MTEYIDKNIQNILYPSVDLTISHIPTYKGSLRSSVFKLNEPDLKEYAGWKYPIIDSIKGYHANYELTIPPKKTPTSTQLTDAASSTIEFDIEYNPSYYVKDNECFHIELSVGNTSAAQTITPTWVPMWWDQTKGIEFLSQDVVFWTVPSPQIFLDRVLFTSEAEYKSRANLLNLSAATLAATSYTAIGTSVIPPASIRYTMSIPNPFPKWGLWLGAFKSNSRLTIRLNTVPSGVVAAGTGTLVIYNAWLRLDCVRVPEREFAALQNLFAKLSWHAFEVVPLAHPAITTVASGDSPNIELKTFRNLEIAYMHCILHVSKSTTANAYWALYDMTNAGATYGIKTKEGRYLFSNLAMPVQYERYVRATRHFSDTNLFNLQPHFPLWISPNTERTLKYGELDYLHTFTGDENLVFTDVGAATAVYPEVFAYVLRTVSIDETGRMSKL